MRSFLRKRTSVVLVTADAYPFAGSAASGTGVQALPEALSRRGYHVVLVAPKYRRPAIESLPLVPAHHKFLVPVGGSKVPVSVVRAEAPVSAAPPVDHPADPDPPARRFRVYFIENAKYFDRERLFGSESAPYLDNDERFVFFCRAVLEFLRRARVRADVIHCHDWPTALVPLFLRAEYGSRRPFRNTASVLTVHDPSVRGDFPPESFALTGLSWDLFTPERLAPAGRFDFTVAGFLHADALWAGDEATAEAVRSGGAGADLAAILERRARPAGEDVPDGEDSRFAFGAPASGRDVADLYRRAVISRKGGSHVR